MLNMEHLIQFLAAADTGSITRAAARLMISHPTVSRNVHALEAQLGVRLLKRTATGTELTDAGRAFCSGARELVDRARELEMRMHVWAQGHSGQLKIVTLCAMTEVLLRVCRVFLQKHSNIDTIIRSDFTFNTQALDSGAADILYMFEAPDVDLSLYNSLPLSADRYVLLLSSAHPAAGRDSITMEEIGRLDIPTLWYPHTLRMLDMPVPAGTPDISGIYHNIKTYQEELFDVRMGKIAAIVPLGLARDAGSDCRFLTLPEADEARICRYMLAIWRPDNPNPCLPAFLEVLRDHTVPPETLAVWRSTT